MDFSPLVNDAVGVLAAVAAACAPIVTAYVVHKAGLDKDTALRDSLNTALSNGIGAGLAYAERAGDARLSNVTIKDAAVKAIADYAIANAPDAVKHFGLTNDQVAAKAANFLQKHLSITQASVVVVPPVVSAHAVPPAPKPAAPSVPPVASAPKHMTPVAPPVVAAPAVSPPAAKP